jgi:hypothetical protein
VALDDLDSAINIATGEVSQNDDPLFRLDSAIDNVTTTQKKRAATVTSIATKFNPDQIAQSRNLGRKVGLSDAIAERNPEEVRRKFISQQVEELYDTSPVAGRKLGNPEFAKLTHDITDELRGNEAAIKQLALTKKGFRAASELSRAMSDQSFSDAVTRAKAMPFDRGLGDVVGGFGRSVAAGVAPRVGQGIYGALASPFGTLAPLLDPLVGTVLPANPLRVAEQGLLGLSQDQSNIAQSIVGDTSEQGFVERAVNSGFESLGMNLPPLLAGVVSNNPSLALNAMVSLTGGQEYAKAREQGLDANQALTYAASQLGVEYFTEKLPVDTLFKGLRGEAGLLKTLLLSNVQEQIGEQAATVLQDLNEWAALNPDKPFNDYLAERPEAALQTAISTLVGTTGQVAIAKSIEAAGNFVTSEQEKLQYQSEAANNSMQAFAEIQQLASQSKLKERSAQDFATFLQEAGGENGIDEVYIDARTFVQEAEKLGVDLNTLMQSSPVINQQLQDAVAQGVDLVIPVGEFGASIAGTDLGGAVLQHLRADEDGISAFEARTQLDTAVEELQKQAEQVTKKYQNDEAWTQSLNEVSYDVLSQLNTVARFPNETNQAYVNGLVAPWYSTLASNLGITPDEAYARYPLEISGQAFAKGFDQANSQIDTPEFKNWFGDSKVTDAEGKPLRVYHGTTADFSEFSKELQGSNIAGHYGGFFFAKKADIASSYAKKEGANVLPVYLKIENPAPTYEDFAKDLSYDGFQNSKISVVRSQTQIKSAIGNRGTFDPNDANILNQSDNYETKEFKKWFKKSKVVDKSGKPLTVYHGTDAIFNIFDYTKIGTQGVSEGAGFYFTNSQDVAKGYGNPLEVNLSIQKPLAYDAKPFNRSVLQRLIKRVAEIESQVTEMGIGDGFLSNYGDINYDGFNRVLRDATESMVDEETALDQISSIINSGVDIETVNKAVFEVTGYDGVVSKGFSNEGSEDNTIYVAFFPEQVKSTSNTGAYNPANRDIYNQQARGQISFGNDITKGANITLLKNADASTFIHELGHFFLEVYADVASKPDAPQVIVDDMNQLFNWFGIESAEQPALDVWRNMTIEQKRLYHQKLARGFEQYAMEGTAPTLELSRVFAKLRSFMLSAYKSLKQFFERSGDPGLTKEVRQVFDRMLASDDAINKAQAMRGMMPMFASMEESGMSVDEYAEYLQNQQDATDEAKTELTARSLRDMKWLQGARSRVLRDLQRQADTERRMVRMAVRREVMTQPVYQAYSWLKQIPDETKAQQSEKVKATKGVDVEKDSLYTAIAKLGGLNRQLAASEWGIDPKDKFDSGVFGKPVLRKDGGLSVDEMAEALAQYEYLTLDENGKWDLREFEDKFFEEARGERQYSLFAEGEQYRKWQESIYDEQERVRLDAFGKGKLDLNSMKAMYGEDGEWQNLGIGRTGMVMQTGNPPDAVAELFGFNSGDHLVKSLLAAENPKALIDRMTDERMLAEFGDLVDAKRMNAAADKAVHNEVRARVLATELSAQNKALGNRRVLEAAAKEYAQQKIAQKLVKDIKPYIYTRAEEKSAKLAEKAMRQGDTNTVVQAKRDQLLNNRIAKEAFLALDEIEKYIDKVRKLNKSSVQSNMRGEPLVQMLSLLERFDFRTGISNAQLAEMRGKEPLAQWVEKEAERLVAVIPDLPDFVLDETYRKSYKDMTLAELRDLMGAVTQLEQLARRENKQYKEIRNQTFQEEKATILEQIRKTYPQLFDTEGKVKADIPSLVVKLEDKLADSKDGMLSGYLNITAMAEILDGGQTNGTVFESLFSRYSEASNYKSNRLSEIYAELKPYLKDQYSLAERRAFSRRDIGTNTVGISLTRENAVVAVALYGSEEGRQRLSNWFDAGQMQQVIDLLDKRDIELVKTLWRVSDEMIWPELEAVNNRTKGISPPKVKGVAFDTKFGTLEGGYFHLDYRSADNPEKGVQVQSYDASKSLDELRAGIGMSRATRQGTSKERVTQSNLRPNLHLDVFSSAINETLHDIAFREALADTMRLLNDNQVALALKKSLGEKHYKAITQRISEIAIPQYNPTGMLEKAFSIARKNTVAVLLSGMTTALQNFTGLSPALTKVKPALVLKNLAKFYSPSMAKNINFTIENSPYMKSRLMNGYDRDVQGIIKEFTVNSNITPDTKYALFLMGLVDVGVSFPVWNAAFEQHMAETKNDVEASVKFADAVIQTTMGSGRDVDQSTLISGKGATNAFKQLFLMFFNYFQAQGQRLVVAGAISKQQWNSGNRANAVANFAVKYVFIVALPAIMTEFLFGWGDDDDDEYMKRSIESVVFFQTAMVPLVRDVARPVWNQFDEDVRSFGYKMSPVESAIQMAIQTPGSIQDLWEGSGDDRDIKRVIMGAGFLTGMPGKLISDVTLGTKAYMEGEAGPQAIVVGPPRN